jgi:hypothetical protein
MKWINQVALLLLVVAGVGGLTFMTQYTRTPVETSRASRKNDDGPKYALRVPEKVAVWDPADPLYAAEFERHSKGHYDFWVSNTNDQPVDVRLHAKGCTCSEVQVGVIPADAWANWQATVAALDVLGNVVGGPNLAAPLAVSSLPGKVQWKTLEPGSTDPDQMARVPPADGRAGPQIAVLRLKWETKEPQPMRLTATIDHHVGTVTESTVFEVPIQVVPPFITSTVTVSVGDLSYNDIRETGFYCWTSTRPRLDLTVVEVPNDPCVDVGPARLLSPAETAELPKMFPQANFRPTCGYFIPVKVYERREGNQLDLGPLARKIEVKSGANEQSVVMIQGMVRGSVRLDESERDRIDLGNFSGARGTDKAVTLTATEAELRIKVESATPDALDVELKETSSGFGRKQWKLTVIVPPNKLAGVLPQNSAVILVTETTPPRRIRVPVVGNATH